MTTISEPLAPWLRDLNRLFAGNGGANAFLPPADLVVTDQDVTLHMDVPGVRPDNLQIELENDLLMVRGERPWPYGSTDDERVWLRIERSFGRFERDVRVPRGLNPDAIDASLVDGVLTARIPHPTHITP